jgi:hypothetical protein
MTRERLKQLAMRRPEKIEPLQKSGKRDTYMVIEVFKDTSFLTEERPERDKQTAK